MNPADVMGTFLRVWREEWARLSRAQLAYKVAEASGDASVTTDIVRRWEEGQPPRDDGQLDGLLAVMGKANGGNLSRLEVRQFERLCAEAVVARRYPQRAWFAGEPFALQEGVDSTAIGLFERECVFPCSVNVMELTAAISELDGAVTLPAWAKSRGGRAQARSQEVALAYLRAALAHYQQCAGRFRLAAQASRQNAAFLSRAFRLRSPDGKFSVIGERTVEAFDRALDNPAGNAERLVELAEEALALGEPTAAASAFFNGLGLLAQTPGADLTGFLPRVEGWLRVAESVDPEGRATAAHFALFGVAVSRGEWDDAERQLAGFDVWAKDEGMLRVLWHGACAEFLFKRGDRDEARKHLEAGLAVARSHGFGAQERAFVSSIEEIERAPKPGRATKARR